MILGAFSQNKREYMLKKKVADKAIELYQAGHQNYVGLRSVTFLY